MKTEKAFDRVDRVVYKVLKGISYVSLIFLVAIAALAFINVILEKLQKGGISFISGIPNTNVWIQYMNVPVVYLTAAFVTLNSGHTNMDILTKHYPRWLQNTLQIIADFCGAAVIAFIANRGIVKVVADQFKFNTRIDSTLATAFPEWPFGIVYVFGMCLLCFSFLWQALRVILGRPAVNHSVDMDEMKERIIAEEAADKAAEQVKLKNNGKEAEN